MESVERSHAMKRDLHFRSLAGIMLIVAGALLFADQYLKTTWLTLLILPGSGLFLYQFGLRERHSGLIITGGLLGGLGLGLLAAFNPNILQASWAVRAGSLLVFFAAGWVAVLAGTRLFTELAAWWSLIPAGITFGLGLCLLLSPFRWTDIVLYAGLGVAVPLLVWGLARTIYGLVIAGSLLLVIGPGIYLAWGVPQPHNSLAQTGIMLIWFSLGWVFITAFSRMIFNRYAWWPLIPGGILAMVGFGLYIGGDPGNAIGFISNTGSIGLMVMGLYLLLMRKGIHH